MPKGSGNDFDPLAGFSLETEDSGEKHHKHKHTHHHTIKVDTLGLEAVKALAREHAALEASGGRVNHSLARTIGLGNEQAGVLRTLTSLHKGHSLALDGATDSATSAAGAFADITRSLMGLAPALDNIHGLGAAWQGVTKYQRDYNGELDRTAGALAAIDAQLNHLAGRSTIPSGTRLSGATGAITQDTPEARKNAAEMKRAFPNAFHDAHNIEPGTTPTQRAMIHALGAQHWGPGVNQGLNDRLRFNMRSHDTAGERYDPDAHVLRIPPDVPSANRWDAAIEAAARRAGVSARLVKSVMLSESGGNPWETSRTGARGLMQLMPDTAAGLGVTSIFNPTQNLDAGAEYLAQMLRHYHGDTRKAVAAYNAGPGAVDRAGGVPNYPETQRYVREVMNRLQVGLGPGGEQQREPWQFLTPLALPRSEASLLQRQEVARDRERISSDKNLLTMLEASYAGREGPAAFKDFAATADRIGADWKVAQRSLASAQGKLSDIMLLDSPLGDFSSYGQYRDKVKDRFYGIADRNQTEADRAQADDNRELINDLKDTINTDKRLLQIAGAPFAGQGGLDSFKELATKMDPIGKEWRQTQMQLAMAENDPATYVALASTRGDFSDYGAFRAKLKAKMLKQGASNETLAKQDASDRAQERLQSLIDGITEGVQSGIDRFAQRRRPKALNIDQNADEMKMLTGERDVRTQSVADLGRLMFPYQLLGTPVPKDLKDAFTGEVDSLGELNTNIRDLEDAVAGKKAEAFIKKMTPLLTHGLNLIPRITAIPGTLSHGAFQAGENDYLDYLRAGDSTFKTKMGDVLGGMGDSDMAMGAGAYARRRSPFGTREGNAGGMFGYGNYSYGGYGSGGGRNGALVGVPADLKAFGTLAGMTTTDAYGNKVPIFGKTGAEIGQYANVAAGAFGILNAGAQQGITIGSVLGGAQQGASIGGMFGPAGALIGAGVGGVLDLIGGLFHPHHVDQGTYDTQPAFVNSPADFDYQAYRFRATGSMAGLTGPQSRFFNTPAPVITIHNYVDGIKQSVTTHLAEAGSLGRATLTNNHYDATRPI